MGIAIDKHLRRARTLFQDGQKGEAAQIYLDVLTKYPGNRRARAGLAETGRITDVAEAEKLQSDLETVATLLKMGAGEAALTCAEAMVARSPHIPQTHQTLAKVAMQLEKHDIACRAARVAVHLAPENLEIALTSVWAKLKNGARQEAFEDAEVLLERAPASPECRHIMGVCHVKLDQCAAAIPEFDRAIAGNPEVAEYWMNRARAAHALGRRDDALDDMREARRLAPDNAHARQMYSVMTRIAPDDPVVAEMEALLAKPTLGTQERVKLHFGLGKSFDDMGRAGDAFENWQAGNALNRQRSSFSWETAAPNFAWAMNTAQHGLRAQLHPDPATMRRPIFILGMPRSGTSLVEQILARHGDVHGGGELNALGNAVNAIGEASKMHTPLALATVRDFYLGKVATLTPRAKWVTDKQPFNFLLTGVILAAMPDARIIHLRRDPMAVCWSNFRYHFPDAHGVSDFSNDLVDIGKYYQLYDRLMRAWERAGHEQLLTVDYEALVDDPEAGTRAILDHVGLDWDPACLRPEDDTRAVMTASAIQVRRPIYKGSSQAWRKYEAYLDPLKEALGDLAPTGG